jgi:NADH-quinone oxidoreductase subunit L
MASEYYACASLLCASMLGLVLSGGLLQILVCWEVTGLSFYLLARLRHDRDADADARMFAGGRAFTANILGDVLFLVGVMMLCARSGSLDLADIQARAVSGGWGAAWVGVVASLLFCGTACKSGLAPACMWLCDAAEAPAPASALIHVSAAVACVHVLSRLFFLFSLSQGVMVLVFVTGGVTAVFAALVAVAQDDIRRALSFSCASQVGCMILTLGAGGAAAGRSHLLASVLPMALLFLVAGKVVRLEGTSSIRVMRGLGKQVPWAFWSFAAAALALSGVSPFAVSFGGNAIPSPVAGEDGFPLLLAVAASLLTLLNMGRIFFVAFLGEPRAGELFPRSRALLARIDGNAAREASAGLARLAARSPIWAGLMRNRAAAMLGGVLVLLIVAGVAGRH